MINPLTLTALSLFFKFLPISNTGDSIAYILATVHFLYPKLGSFSDMEHYFYQLAYRDSKVPKRFVGLNQMQCSPFFDCNCGNKMTPLHVGTSYTHDFRFYSKENASSTHQSTWAGSLKPQFAWAARGVCPLRTPINGGTPPFKIPPYSLFRPNGSQKSSKFFSHFYGLVPDTNYKNLEGFVMLVTHSEPRRSETSHICDISPLRVN